MLVRIRWIVAGLLFLGGLINYLDRSALSVAAPLIVSEMHLTSGQLGIVFSSFFVGYTLFSFIGGAAADRFGSYKVLTTSMVAWSTFCALTAAAFSFPVMLVVRLLFGAAEGPFPSNVTKTVSLWFPQSERATAVGIGNAGTPLGGAVAGPVVGLLALNFGWRIAFIGVAAIGIVWVIIWCAIVSDRPENNRLVSAVERDEILTSRGNSISTASGRGLSYYLRQPAVLATICAFFCYAYLLYFFLAWFPSYLTKVQHLDLRQMSGVSAIPWFFGFVGFLLGGFICDLLARRLDDVLLARKLVLVTCLLTAGVCAVLAGWSDGAVMAVSMMALSIFFVYLAGHTYWAIILELVETERVGTVGGFAHFIANISGIIAPIVTGYLVEWTGQFTVAFVLAGCIAAFGALSVAIFVRTTGPQPAISLMR
jgi:ACS family hexuronate transporter-like MFS transporter